MEIKNALLEDQRPLNTSRNEKHKSLSRIIQGLPSLSVFTDNLDADEDVGPISDMYMTCPQPLSISQSSEYIWSHHYSNNDVTGMRIDLNDMSYHQIFSKWIGGNSK